MARIFIFIDESGQVNHRQLFFTAGAIWCIPRTATGIKTALHQTWKEMIKHQREIIGHRIDELKYSHGAKKSANELLQILEGKVSSDNTIDSKNCIWDGLPVSFTTIRTHLGTEAQNTGTSIEKACENPDFANRIRGRFIKDLILPLIIYEDQNPLEVAIILDGDIWKPCTLGYYGENLEKLIANSRINVELKYANSKEFPGLQIADIVAGVIRDYSANQVNDKAFNIIMRHTLYHIGRKVIKGVQPLE